MRYAFILALAVVILNGCGKKPNMVEPVPGAVSNTYPQTETVPGW